MNHWWMSEQLKSTWSDDRYALGLYNFYDVVFSKTRQKYFMGFRKKCCVWKPSFFQPLWKSHCSHFNAKFNQLLCPVIEDIQLIFQDYSSICIVDVLHVHRATLRESVWCGHGVNISIWQLYLIGMMEVCPNCVKRLWSIPLHLSVQPFLFLPSLDLII